MTKPRGDAIRYDAIFFDFDGVLVESLRIKADAFSALYEEFGAEVLARVLAHHKANEGISRLTKIRHCHKEFLGVDLTERELAALGRRYSSLVEDAVVSCPGSPGAEAFLDAHHKRIALFVVSGTPESELNRVVERRGMGAYFRAVHGSPRLKDDIVSQVVAENGYQAKRTLFVGDAMADFEAARATGVPFIGRVAAGRADPFPEGTEVIPDLTHLKA